MRDRLIELLSVTNLSIEDACCCADYLLANGVIVPPCKVGDTVWFDTYKKNATVCIGIQPHMIDRVDISFVCDTKNLIETKIPDWSIGKTAFLTKEEAEAALKGGAE